MGSANGMHYKDSNSEYDECAYDLEPWPCSAALAEAEARNSRTEED